MNNCYLDANLLVYLEDLNSPFNQQARTLIKKLVDKGYQLVITALCLDEYFHAVLRLSTKPKEGKLADLKLSLAAILKIPGIKLVNPPLRPRTHMKVVNLMVEYNLRPRDAYHLFIALENKVRFFATFDHDFEAVFKRGLVRKFN